MSDSPTPARRLDIIKNLIASRRFLGLLAAVFVLVAAGTGGYYYVAMKPLRALVQKRVDTHNLLMKLYDLQLGYRAKYGAYANDLETLLASSPEGPAVRARLQANVDMNTLTVVGDSERFRLEANVLDPQRTILKLRGPLPSKTVPRRPPARELPEPIATP